MMDNFDHIKPLAMNGPHIHSNLQALCPLCHFHKTCTNRSNIARWKKKKKPEKKRVRRNTEKTITVPGTNIKIKDTFNV